MATLIKDFLKKMFPTVEETVRVHDQNHPENPIEAPEQQKTDNMIDNTTPKKHDVFST